MSLLQALARTGALRTLDHALAQSLRRLDPDTPDAVLAAAALASLAVASGHAGFDPAEPQRLLDTPVDWPTPQAWHGALQASRWVALPDAGDAGSAPDAPLVYEHGLVYLRRYREYERRLALGLQRIAAHSPPPFAAATLAPLFEQLFPQASPLPQGEGARRAGEGTGLPEPSIYQDGTNPPCLLYTSPSPRDVEESRMPSSA